MRVSFFGVITIISFLISSCAFRALKTLSNAELSNNSTSYKIDFNEEYGLAVIPLTIEGVKYNFVFDTGAQTTVISSRLSKKIAFDKKGSISTSDAKESSQNLIYGTISNIYLDSLHYTNVGVVVNDFSANPQFSCVDIDGILGANMINLSNWEINFIDRYFKIFNIENDLNLSTAYNPISFNLKRGIPYVEFNINDTTTIDFMIDSGKNSDIISISNEVDFNIPKLNRSSVGYLGFGMFGNSEIDTTDYYKTSLSNSNASFSNVIISQSKENKSLIGIGFLQKHYNSVLFDFKNNLMYAEKKQVDNDEYLSDGISPMLLNNETIVIGSKNVNFSPDVDKLNVGDTIVGINNVSLENTKSACELLDEIWRSNKNQESITLKVSRMGKISTFILPNKNL